MNNTPTDNQDDQNTLNKEIDRIFNATCICDNEDKDVCKVHDSLEETKGLIKSLITHQKKQADLEGKLEAARYFRNYMISNSPFITEIIDPYIAKLETIQAQKEGQ